MRRNGSHEKGCFRVGCIGVGNLWSSVTRVGKSITDFWTAQTVQKICTLTQHQSDARHLLNLIATRVQNEYILDLPCNSYGRVLSEICTTDRSFDPTDRTLRPDARSCSGDVPTPIGIFFCTLKPFCHCSDLHSGRETNPPRIESSARCGLPCAYPVRPTGAAWCLAVNCSGHIDRSVERCIDNPASVLSLTASLARFLAGIANVRIQLTRQIWLQIFRRSYPLRTNRPG